MTTMARTDFAKYSHAQLYAMLYAGDPSTAQNAAEAWDATGNSLHNQANTLEAQLTGFQGNWTGGAAESYNTMITDLIGGIRKVADTAYSMRNLAYDAADAQNTARAEMPAPVDVPTVAPATLALATAPIQIDASTPATVVAQLQQARSSAISAVQAQQQASAAADAAQAKAAQVMTTLAGSYVTTQDDIPPAPDAQQAPAVPSGDGVTAADSTDTPINANLTAIYTDGQGWSMSGNLTDPNAATAGTTTTDTTDPDVGSLTGDSLGETDSPLFGNMFTAGVAAASAAVFGRFGSLIPKVPSFVGNKKQQQSGSDPATDGTDPNATPKLGDRTAALDAAKLGGGGAGGLGGIKTGGLGGLSGGSTPTTSNLLSAPSATGTLDSGIAGAVGGAASSSGTSSPMMPMMPMSGMGAGSDMGGGRRVPPWLVETEDVWNESSAVSPTVIGEEL